MEHQVQAGSEPSLPQPMAIEAKEVPAVVAAPAEAPSSEAPVEKPSPPPEEMENKDNAAPAAVDQQPSVQVDVEPQNPVGALKAAPEAATEMPSDEVLIARLQDVLKTVDLGVTTGKNCCLSYSSTWCI